MGWEWQPRGRIDRSALPQGHANCQNQHVRIQHIGDAVTTLKLSFFSSHALPPLSVPCFHEQSVPLSPVPVMRLFFLALMD